MNARMSDVAARAGVSSQTVSRVLRGEQWVAEATATRVRQAMQELGYHGNEVAGALKRGRTRTLGLLFPYIPCPSGATLPPARRASPSSAAIPCCCATPATHREGGGEPLAAPEPPRGRHRLRGAALPARDAPGVRGAGRVPPAAGGAQRATRRLPAAHVRTDDERAGYVAVRHLLDLGRRSVRVVANGLLTTATRVRQRRPYTSRSHRGRTSSTRRGRIQHGRGASGGCAQHDGRRLSRR